MGDIICFSDSGNKCLRGVKKGATFSVIENCENLKDIHFDGKKLFFLNGSSVSMLSSEGDKSHLFEVYRVERKIKSFCPSSKGSIYLLEECNGNQTEETKKA